VLLVLLDSVTDFTGNEKRAKYLRETRKAKFQHFARCGVDDSNEHYQITFKVVPTLENDIQLISSSPEFNDPVTFVGDINSLVSKKTGILYKVSSDLGQIKYTMKDEVDPRVVELSAELCPI
jgi:hypothetical protein